MDAGYFDGLAEEEGAGGGGGHFADGGEEGEEVCGEVGLQAGGA